MADVLQNELYEGMFIIKIKLDVQFDKSTTRCNMLKDKMVNERSNYSFLDLSFYIFFKHDLWLLLVVPSTIKPLAWLGIYRYKICGYRSINVGGWAWSKLLQESPFQSVLVC